MVEAFKLLGEISLRGGEAVRGQLESIGSSVEKNTTKFGALGKALSLTGVVIGTAVAGMTTIGGALLKMGFDYNTMKENSTVAWTTLLGSQEKAKQQVAEISQFAAKTQFNTEGVDTMAKYFHNAGFEGKGLFDQLTKIADVSGAFNITADNAKELARQMSQVDQAGVAYTSDLDILQNQGIPIFKALAQVTGTNVAQVRKMASQGKITADMYNKAFDSVANTVKGSAQKQSETMTGLLSTLGDQVSIFAGTLTEGLFNKAKGLVNNLNNMISAMNAGFTKGGIKGALDAVFPKATTDMILGTLKGIQDAFKWFQDNWKGLVADLTALGSAFVVFKTLQGISSIIKMYNEYLIAYRDGTVLATLAEWGFNTALLANPLTWVALAIGALIGIIVLLWLNWDKVSKWFTTSWATFKKFATQLWTDIKNNWNTQMGQTESDLKKIWTAISTWCSTAWGAIKTKASSIFNSLKSDLSGIWNSISGTAKSVWGGIKSTASDVWNGIKNTISKAINDAKSAVSTGINAIKGFFSGMHISIPKIPLPHFHASGKFSLNPLSVPNIGVTWAQTGGIVDGATLLGAGEAGKELLMPLEGRYMQPFAQAVAGFLNDAVSKRTTGGETMVPLIVNGRELARAIIVDIDQEMQRRTNIRKRGV